MEQVTVSSKGQIAIPKSIREMLNITEGAKLTLEVRGREIVLSTGDAWKELRGAAADAQDLMEKFAAFRKEEREGEDPGY